MANFVIKRFYGGRVTISQAAFIATGALMHAKDYVPGCGGASRVIAMFQRGDVGWVHHELIREYEQFLRDFDRAIQPVFFGGSDASVSNEQFAQRVDVLSHDLKALRKAEAIQKSAEQVSEDVKIAIPAGKLTLAGDWISPAISSGAISNPATPTVTPESSKPGAAKPTRQRSTRGRKVRPPSQA